MTCCTGSNFAFALNVPVRSRNSVKLESLVSGIIKMNSANQAQLGNYCRVVSYSLTCKQCLHFNLYITVHRVVNLLLEKDRLPVTECEELRRNSTKE